MTWSFKQTGRIAGVLYLVIILFAGFAEGAVREQVIVFESAEQTVENISDMMQMYRLGLVADIIAFTCDAAVAVLLYVLLAPVNKTLSMVTAVMRLIAHPAIAMANLINFATPLWVIDGTGEAVSGTQLQTVMSALEAHHAGYLIAGAMFGVHCILLGMLMIRSEQFPRILGALISIAGMAYLIESFGGFLAPQHEDTFQMVVVVPAVIAELSLCLYLIVKGVAIEPSTTN